MQLQLLWKITTAAAMIAGFVEAPLFVLLFIGAGYFYYEVTVRQHQTIRAVNSERPGLAASLFLMMFITSAATAGIVYGIGFGIRWLLEAFI